MCSVPSMWSRIRRTAAAGVALLQQPHQPPVLRIGVGEHLLRVGDQGDQRAHLPLHLGHRGDQPRRVGRLGHADVKADVGAAVIGEVPGRGHPLHVRAEPSQIPLARALARQDHGPRLDSNALVEHLPCLGTERLAGGFLGQGRVVGHEGPATASTPGGQVAALDEGGQRLPQGGAGDLELVGQVTLGRQARAGRQQPDADRGPQALDGLLECGRRLHRIEHGLGGRGALHRPKVPRAVLSGVGLRDRATN